MISSSRIWQGFREPRTNLERCDMMFYGTLVIYAMVIGSFTAGAVLAIIAGLDRFDDLRKR